MYTMEFILLNLYATEFIATPKYVQNSTALCSTNKHSDTITLFGHLKFRVEFLVSVTDVFL